MYVDNITVCATNFYYMISGVLIENIVNFVIKNLSNPENYKNIVIKLIFNATISKYHHIIQPLPRSSSVNVWKWRQERKLK